MNCKQGDLAIVVGDLLDGGSLGSIVRCIGPRDTNCPVHGCVVWIVDPPTRDGWGAVCDHDLRPIRGLPETETTQEQQPCTA